MTKGAAVGVVVVVWLLTSIPAVVLALWLGLVEPTLLGAVQAFVVIGAISLVFEFLKRKVHRRLQLRRARRHAVPTSER